MEVYVVDVGKELPLKGCITCGKVRVYLNIRVPNGLYIYMNDLFLIHYCTSSQDIPLRTCCLHMHAGKSLRAKRNQQKNMKMIYETG